jgi:ribosomal protein L11 methyltransferase
MELVEIRADIPVNKVEAVEEALLEAGRERWSVWQDVIAQRAAIVGIFPSETEALADWREVERLVIAAGIPEGAVPAVRTLAEQDWRDSYKEHFRAWSFGTLHWVPTWERETFRLPPGHAVLWLDPGLAFGTGNHETTRLCCERLVALAEEFGVRNLEVGNQGAQVGSSKVGHGLRVIDAGCGSGILALSAALLGFREVAGFDNDPDAVRVSQENAVANGLADQVEFFVGDLTGGLRGRKAEIVLANIQADVLVHHAEDLVAAVAPGGTLVLSGILAKENSETRTAFEKVTPGWTINARTMGEWSDVVLTRPVR